MRMRSSGTRESSSGAVKTKPALISSKMFMQTVTPKLSCTRSSRASLIGWKTMRSRTLRMRWPARLVHLKRSNWRISCRRKRIKLTFWDKLGSVTAQCAASCRTRCTMNALLNLQRWSTRDGLQMRSRAMTQFCRIGRTPYQAIELKE